MELPHRRLRTCAECVGVSVADSGGGAVPTVCLLHGSGARSGRGPSAESVEGRGGEPARTVSGRLYDLRLTAWSHR